MNAFDWGDIIDTHEITYHSEEELDKAYHDDNASLTYGWKYC